MKNIISIKYSNKRIKMINKIKNFLIENKTDLTYILFLLIILLVISIPKLLTQINVGIGNWDTYLYLENGRSFAQMGWGDVPSIAPVVPYVLSLMFRLNGTYFQEAIFYLDVFAYILGSVSFYLLLRFKFDYNISLVGSVIYSTFTLLYSWVAIGGNDIPGVSLTILTIYLILVAHNFNNKYYYLALPIAAFAFLTRYTAGIMIFSIIFYLIIKRINLKEITKFIIGGIIGIICVSPSLYHFYRVLKTPFPFLNQFSGTVSNTKVLDSGYLPNPWYYITHIHQYLSSNVPQGATFDNIVNLKNNIPTIISYILIILMIIGMVLIIYNIYQNVKNKDKITFKTRKNLLLTIIFLFLTIVCIFTVGQVSYIITTVLILGILVIISLLFKKYEIEHLDYDLLMISLFLVYLVFQSILSTKNDRYFITVLPFMAYFITNTISYIYSYINNKELKLNKIKPKTVLTLLIIIFFVSTSLGFASSIPTENHYKDIEESCEWFIQYYPEYRDYSIIYSDNWPAVTWYLNIFCSRAVLDNKTHEGVMNLSAFMLGYDSDRYPGEFYIDTNTPIKYDYPGFTKVKTLGDVTIYENTYLLTHNEQKDLLNTTNYNETINEYFYR